ncbi:MAG: PIG-L family deacetylase [Candidatus Omnitrophica bacterium]|nr:PIG-L family deacetylase [Candidatus Omnitrophota bacterium]
MFNRLIYTVIILLLSSVSSLAQQPAAINSLEPFNKEDRVLILAPHPDDEAIACAGVIQQALASGAKVRIAYLTNGDHNQIAFIVYEKRITMRKGEFIYMGEVRRKEAIKAMLLLGLQESDLVFLGYPDFGTFTIFNRYWQAKRPFSSLLTRISAVPYKENLSYQAPYVGESMLKDMEKVLSDFRPNKIFVSHPADANADHRTLYLFLQIALQDLKQELAAPKIYPYLIHCLGWPSPRNYHPELALRPPEKFQNNHINWSELLLSPDQLEKKRQAIVCYKSQTETSGFYLLSFARENELFGDYAAIDLARQGASEGKSPAFSGFSNMFQDNREAQEQDIEQLPGDEGIVSYALMDNVLFIRFEKTKEPVHRYSIMLYLFGYASKTPFARMPKIRINANQHAFKVFDGKKLIKPDGISVESEGQGVMLKIPLSILGDPEFILTSMRTYGGILPVNTSGFRRIVIK